MLERRQFFELVATAFPAATTFYSASAQGAENSPSLRSLAAQRSGSNACLPDWKQIKSRIAPRTEILYKTPRGKPNGIALTDDPELIWITDQSLEHWITLMRLSDGKVIREFQADVIGPSGLVVDGDLIWITSTHNSLIVLVDSKDGRTVAKYQTPGSGRKYNKLADPPGRSSKLPIAHPEMVREVGGYDEVRFAGLKPGQLPLDTQEYIRGNTGAEGVLIKEGNLIYSCTACRSIFAIEKSSWEVQSVWPTPGNRPHGMSWADSEKRYFWNCDANENAFYRFNATTGEIVERVQVQDDPYTVCHGTKLIGDYMYFCDDNGWMYRIRWN
jgi:hypothetical protein